MAGRPPKEGIDFSGWVVDIFDSDPKIDKLLDSQGAAGFLVYFYLCQRAYGSKGYFYSWSYDDAATTARKIGGGVGSETVRQTVNLCLQIGLFDKRLFDGDGILTSRGIQKRYWQVAKDRTCNTIIPEYWLLDKAGKTNNHTQNDNKQGGKSNYEAPKFNYQTQKESKVKKSKGKQSDAPARDDEDEHGNPVIDPVWKAVADRYLLKLGMLSGGTNESDLLDFTTKMGPDIVCLAIDATKEQGPDNPLPYLLKVLSNWEKAGIKTLQQAQAYLDDYKRKIAKGNKTSTQGTGNGFLDMLNGGAGSGS